MPSRPAGGRGPATCYKASVRSMTGFGSGHAPLGAGRVVVDVRAVNHRFFEARVKLPASLQEHSTAVEDVLRRELERGRVECSARLEGERAQGSTLDFGRARAALADLVRLRDEVAPGEPVPFGLLASVPDLFHEQGPVDSEQASHALAAAARDAAHALDRMRRKEGEALRTDLLGHLSHVHAHMGSFRARLPEIVAGQRARLRERIARLLEDTGVDLDPGRLEHEVALLADRADVAEELARLESHCRQFEELTGEGSAVGRKLDFLLQEMAREVNTLGSKTADAPAARLVVELKTDVERLREQVQNVL